MKQQQPVSGKVVSFLREDEMQASTKQGIPCSLDPNVTLFVDQSGQLNWQIVGLAPLKYQYLRMLLRAGTWLTIA